MIIDVIGGKMKMKILKSIAAGISFGAVEISGWIALLLTCLVSLDVILRYIFKQSIPGSMEITQALMTFMVYLVLGAVQEKKDHIRIDFFIERISPRVRKYWEVVICMVGLAFLSFLLVHVWESFYSSLEMKEYYGGMIRIPIYPARGAIFIGVGLMIVALLQDIVWLLASKEKVPIITSSEQREIEEAIQKAETKG